MSPNNLGSLVIAQVTRGGRSILSGRNFSSYPRRNELTGAGKRVVSVERLKPNERFEVFGASFTYAYCAFAAWETIQVVEWAHSAQRVVDEIDGRRAHPVIDRLRVIRHLTHHLIFG